MSSMFQVLSILIKLAIAINAQNKRVVNFAVVADDTRKVTPPLDRARRLARGIRRMSADHIKIEGAHGASTNEISTVSTHYGYVILANFVDLIAIHIPMRECVEKNGTSKVPIS